jgi:hypothetical protein
MLVRAAPQLVVVVVVVVVVIGIFEMKKCKLEMEKSDWSFSKLADDLL